MLKSRQLVADSRLNAMGSSSLPSREEAALNGNARQWIVPLRRIFLLVLLGVFCVKGFVPAWTTLNSDFPNYYLVAKLYRAGYPLERVYEWTWLQRQNDHLGVHQGLVSFIPSTLASALPVLPLTSLAPLQAKRAWLIANLLFLGLTLFLCVRMTRLRWEWCGLLALLLFMPLRNNFLLGQMHLFVLLLLTIGAWLYFRNSQFWSGIALAAAVALKIYPALFLIYFIWKKQWRAAIGVVAGSIIFAALSLYLFGVNTCVAYLREVLPFGLRGETLDPYNPAWNSFTALLKRLLIYEPTLNPHPVVHAPALYALLHALIHVSILVAFLWAIGTREGDLERCKLEWGGFLFLILFLSSQPGTYHLVALILAAVLVGDYLISQERVPMAASALFAYALVGGPLFRVPGVMPTGWQNLLFFPRLLWMSVLAAIVLWALSQRFSQFLDFRNAILAVSSIALLTFLGFLSNQHHLRRQFDNYDHRVLSLTDDLLATDPEQSGIAILFTHMNSKGYSVDRIENGIAAAVVNGSDDAFHPASPADSSTIWAERPTKRESRIIRVKGEGAETVEVNNAEQPVASSDGRLLAFVRETRGRNVLMLRTISPGHDSAPDAVVAGAEFDPHEATFTPDNRLLFSSNREGRFSLYVWSTDEGIRPLGHPSCSARYPAASADGKWIAFSCEERGNWHLNVMRSNGTEQRELTAGECNSVSPVWTSDSQHLIYATDCGRGLGLTALAKIDLAR